MCWKVYFPYTRWSHVSWTGKSLCSMKNLFCFREIEFPYWKSNRMRSLHSFISDYSSIYGAIVIFVFAKPYEVLSDSHNYFILAAILVLPHLWPLMNSFLDTYLFFSCMPITFEILHKCMSIHNTNAFDVLSQSHICYTLATVFVFFFQIFDHLAIPC